MKPDNAKNEFQEYLGRNGLNKNTLTPKLGISAMLAFYREVRADGCRFEDDGDMLLFQWGTFNWGDGEWFELDITRQLIFAGIDGDGDDDYEDEDEDEVDDEIWQLSLTFKYPPTSTLRLLSAGPGSQNRWCQDLNEIIAFERYIHTSDVFQSLADAQPDVIMLDYYCTD